LNDVALLAGRAVVVTGTSRGIGRGIAAGLSAAGADVLAVSRTRTACDAGPGRIVPVAVDLRDETAPGRIVEAALEAFGRVDGLVNNAGVIHFVDCWLHGDAEWDDVFETNLTAPFRLSQAVVRHWLAHGERGVIVNLGSVESEVVIERQAGYAATKGAILGLTRAMALELAPHGIRVNAIGPGVIATEMSEALKGETFARIPMQRLGQVDEISDVAVFLLSDLARYLTGTIVYADGGYTAQ
jgi:NAD(P)-dependent dehydrogenase (short-subunit alcohol dehydrogenase family)